MPWPMPFPSNLFVIQRRRERGEQKEEEASRLRERKKGTTEQKSDCSSIGVIVSHLLTRIRRPWVSYQFSAGGRAAATDKGNDGWKDIRGRWAFSRPGSRKMVQTRTKKASACKERHFLRDFDAF